jgi:hypothetical protein
MSSQIVMPIRTSSSSTTAAPSPGAKYRRSSKTP